MRFLFLILAIAPVLGAEFHTHIRERRQSPNVRAYNQAPAAIKQILAAQQARDPIVHLPPQPIPNLSPSQPIQPQYVKQSDLAQYRPQVQGGQQSQQPSQPLQPQYVKQSDLAQYRPQVQIGQQPQQPTYKQIPVRPAQYTPPAAGQQQYNPQYRTNYAQPRPLPQPQSQQQQQSQPNYQYSKNLPPQLQQLVQIQQNLPNAIPQGQGHQG